MALDVTVGGASADSYATVAELQAYAVNNGLVLTGGAYDLEVALRRGAVYLNSAYSFRGRRQYETQAMDWPRADAGFDDEGWPIDPDTVPMAIKTAQMEAAYLHNSGTALWATETLGAVKRKRVKAGPVESETEYMGGRVAARFPLIERVLRPYTVAGPSGARMVRG